jgi:PIN domain nuclease of toxin-antitoxin system
MRLLLDTHTLLWWDEGTLPVAVCRHIQKADQVFVSAVSAWEIAIKSALGKIVVRGSVLDVIADYGFSELPITVRHAEHVRMLPPHHRDPFDRLLVAQVRVENLGMVSRDTALRSYGIPLVWG